MQDSNVTGTDGWPDQSGVVTRAALSSAISHRLEQNDPDPADHAIAVSTGSYRRHEAEQLDHPSACFAKRALDIVLASAALLLLAPLLVAVALAIRLTSPGPAIFRQKRYGLDSQPFEIFKFRTMAAAACDPSGVQQTRSGDPRVTPLGRFLRRTNIDELPQLLNVLRGDMSLVGPRPHVPGMLASGRLYEDLVPEYFVRHRARPGITGLAQVSGYRGSTENAEAARARIAADLEYLEQWSLRLDLKILWLTVRREIIRGTGM